MLLIATALYVQADETITVDSSVFDKVVAGGHILPLKWGSSRNIKNKVDIYFSSSKDKEFKLIKKDVNDAFGTFHWKCPKINSNNCYIKMVLKDSKGQKISESLNFTKFTIDSVAPKTKIFPKSISAKSNVKLDYTADDGENGSGISKLKLFVRLQGNGTWLQTKYTLDSVDIKNKVDFIVDFNHRGKWDVYLLAEDEAGNSNGYPRSTTKNFATIEVNSGEPVVKFMPMKRNNMFSSNGKMVIRWNAYDDDLTENPIALYYKKGTKWILIEDNLPNTGMYSWNTPSTNLRTSNLRILVKDKTGKVQEDTVTLVVIVDVVPPNSEIWKRGTRQAYIWNDEDKIPRLGHSSNDFDGVGVESVILHWRKTDSQDKKWNKRPVKLMSLYEKIKFDMPDGQYDLILTGIDKVGNAEPYPKTTDSPELQIIINRKKYNIVISKVEEVGDDILVSWNVDYPNISKTPLIFIYADDKQVSTQNTSSGTIKIPIKNRSRIKLYMYTMPPSGNKIESLPTTWVKKIDKKLDPIIELISSYDELLESDKKIGLSFNIKHLNENVSLYEKQNNGEWTNLKFEKDNDRQVLSVLTPKTDLESWQLKLQLKDVSSNVLMFKVDNTVPTVELSVSKADIEVGNVVDINYKVVDKGPAKVKMASLFMMSPGSTVWKNIKAVDLKTTTFPMRFSEPGTYKFTYEIVDELGRGENDHLKNKTIQVTVVEKNVQTLAFVDGQDNKLFSGNQDIELDITSSNLNDNIVITYKDANLTTIRQQVSNKSSVIRLKTPAADINNWSVSISSGVVKDTISLDVDNSLPKASIQLSSLSLTLGGNVAITKKITDTGPASTMQAQIYYLEPNTSQWSPLLNAKSFIPQKKGVYYFSITATDKLNRGVSTPTIGNSIQLNVVGPQDFVIDFVHDDRITNKLIRSGEKVQIRWIVKNLSEKITLEEFGPTGQWRELGKFDSTTTSFTALSPQQDLNNWTFRLKYKNIIRQYNVDYRVDHTIPYSKLILPKSIVYSNEPFDVTVHLNDSGPAGFDKAYLHVRKKGSPWTKVDLGSQKIVTKSFVKEAGDYEFYVQIQDKWGRGSTAPISTTSSPWKLNVTERIGTVQIFQLKKVRNISLIKGKQKIEIELLAKNVINGDTVIIYDTAGNVIWTVKKPGKFTITAPLSTDGHWGIYALVGKYKSNILQYQIDSANPRSKINTINGTNLNNDTNAKIKLLYSDSGPAGIKSVKLFRSDDEGDTWRSVSLSDDLVELSSVILEFKPQRARLFLTLVVEDNNGLRSNVLPTKGIKPDVIISWPGLNRQGFTTFIDANVHKGGSYESIKWQGLTEKAELQYRLDETMPWLPIAVIDKNTISYNWKLPKENSNRVSFRFVSLKKQKELFRSPTPFAIDSNPIKSGLAFKSSDVFSTNIVYTRNNVNGSTIRSSHPQNSDNNSREKEIAKTSSQPNKSRDKLAVSSENSYGFSVNLASAKDAYSRKNYAQAAIYLENAHRKRTDVADSHYLLAKCYIELHRQDKSIVTELLKTVDIDATNSKAWHYLAVFSSRRKDIELARKYYAKALDIEYLPESILNIAKLDVDAGKPSQARDGFIKVLESLRHKPQSGAYKDALLRLTVIYTYSSLKDINKARQYWAEVLTVYGRDSWEGKRAIKWLSENK